MSGARSVFAAVTTDGRQNMTPETARVVAWEETVRNDAGFSLAGSSNIVLEAPGVYQVFVNLPYFSNLARDSAKLELRLDDLIVSGGAAMQGYIRAASGHNDASVHWSGLVVANQSNQALSISTEKASNPSGFDAVVANGRMSVLIERIDTEGLFFSAATQVTTNSTDWNPAPPGAEIEWPTATVQDSGVYTHDSVGRPERLGIGEDGDYLLTYNDGLEAGADRVNPLMTVRVNGIPLPGASTRTHMIRNTQGHHESSGSLVFFLNALSAGDEVSIHLEQDAAGGTVEAAQRALIGLRKKSFDAVEVLTPSVTNILDTTADVLVHADFSSAVYDLTVFWGTNDGGANAGAWMNSADVGWFT
ncbi:MAG: hypothetical protein AAF492_30710, partial [Verrucomicrobiota bacterium]